MGNFFFASEFFLLLKEIAVGTYLDSLLWDISSYLIFFGCLW
jgi:hypothetical protein